MLVEKKNRLVKFYLIAVIVLLIFLHYLGALAWAEKPLFNGLAWIQNNSYVFLTKLKYSFINYNEAQDLKKANDQLKQDLNNLTYQNSQLYAYKLENEKLRSLINFQDGKKFSLVTSDVIGRDLNQPNTLIINRGQKDGIKTGLVAIINDGILIGQVIDVKDYSATILLATDNQVQLAVSTENATQATGLSAGEFGLSLKVNLIPQDLDIKEGDLIITSGSQPDVPRGLIVGKVNRVISQPNELFKSATLNPLTDFNSLTIVSIVIPAQYQ